MNATGQRLARVQLDGHRQIDKAYAPLSIAIAEAIMRYATPDQHGILRPTPTARTLILAEVGRLLDQTRSQLLPVILASVQAARDAAQADTEPIPLPFGEGLDEITTVSRALNTDRQSVLGQTGALLLVGIAGKLAATTVAKTCRQYFSPWFSQYRDVNGKMVHTDRLGAVRNWPGKAGLASQHPRLILLTETTRAHGAAMRRIAERDNLLLKWNLSPQHRDADACSTNARRDNGFGAGLFRAQDFPAIPLHVGCRCYASTAVRV